MERYDSQKANRFQQLGCSSEVYAVHAGFSYPIRATTGGPRDTT